MNDMEQDNQITEQSLQPDLYGDAGKKKRKKPGFAAGVVVGIQPQLLFWSAEHLESVRQEITRWSSEAKVLPR